MTQAERNKIVKAQWIRLADVFVIGPLMVWGGVILYRRNKLAGTALAILGAATVGFNGANAITVAEAAEG